MTFVSQAFRLRREEDVRKGELGSQSSYIKKWERPEVTSSYNGHEVEDDATMNTLQLKSVLCMGK